MKTSPDKAMKPTAPFRTKSRVFATTPCRGLSLSRSPASGARNATPSVFHQRHIGRVLRSSGRLDGRRVALLLGREVRARRCPALRAGNIRKDGGGMAAAGDGSEARLDGRLDGTLRPDDR